MIKKILFIICLFFIGSTAYAEKFIVGEYISGEYIKMVSSDTSKYLTIQMIEDSNGNFVYCIEPFVLVDEDTDEYVSYTSDLSGYKNLTEEQKRKISLIAYYGYGYKDRVMKKWYAITQMLIWRTVDPDSEFYFTDAPNGEKIEKYTGLINLILSDVYSHDIEPNFIKDYNVNYREDLVITNYDYKYQIKSSYDYEYDIGSKTLRVNNVVDDGIFSFERDNGEAIRNVVIYSNDESQDLLRRGKVLNKQYIINVKVSSGEIILDIRKDNRDIYTIESDFTNTCYEISSGKIVLDMVCTTNDDLTYKTEKLPLGEYIIKQVSVGKGYELDTREYKVTIDGSSDTKLVLNNRLISNKLELVKYYCINDNCLYEENALFNVYDKENNLVGSITTDSNGYGNLEVGYGKYTIIQSIGLENYTFVDVYTENITNSKDVHCKELYNYYIEGTLEDYDIFEPGDALENEEEIVTEDILKPPRTGTKLAELIKILYNVIMIVVCYCNLKRFCYNN